MEILGLGSPVKTTLTGIGQHTDIPLVSILTCASTEMFHKELDRVSTDVTVQIDPAAHTSYSQGEAGDNMGVLLRGVKREQIKRGQIIAIPGSIKAVKEFQAQLYVLTKDEGL